jgi:hypothetical protein
MLLIVIAVPTVSGVASTRGYHEDESACIFSSLSAFEAQQHGGKKKFAAIRFSDSRQGIQLSRI